MGMFFAESWAGEQLPLVCSSEVLIDEDVIEGQSWTMDRCCVTRRSWSRTA